MKYVKYSVSSFALAMAALSAGLHFAQAAHAGDKKACNGGTGQGNVQQYCNAAKAADEAADSNQSAMMVHGAVAAVCGAACVGETTGVASMWCTGASVAGGVADAAITKQFSHAMMSLVSGAGALMGAGDMMNEMGNKVVSKLGGPGDFFKPPLEEGGAANDAGSCVTAAMEGFTMFQRGSDASEQEDIAKKNRSLAAQYATPKENSATMITPAPAVVMGAGSAGTSSTSGFQTISNVASSSGSEKGDICNKGASGDFHAAIQCAVASDKTVPGFVNDPRFARDLAKATKMNPDDFAKKLSENPSAAMGAAFGSATGNADLGRKMGALYAGLQSQVVRADTGSAYAGAGGGRKGGGGEPGFDKMFGDIMSQFGPKKGEEKSPGVTELNFGGPRRYPANVEEDRRVSIFERVAARYYHVSGRILAGPAGPKIYK